jgi:hypothetical protein
MEGKKQLEQQGMKQAKQLASAVAGRLLCFFLYRLSSFHSPLKFNRP